MIRRVALVALALIAASCGGGSGSILEAGHRVPDHEGVVTDVSFERIVLDEDRTFLIHPEVESFTTRSHQPASLLGWRDRYVHVGLGSDERVVWVAGIGAVHQAEQAVFYTGILAGTTDGRLVFEDGTVLQPEAGLEVPQEGSDVLVKIDPVLRRVVEITVQ